MEVAGARKWPQASWTFGLDALTMSAGFHPPIARRPLLDWSSFKGLRYTGLPNVGDLPHVRMTTSGRAAIYQALQITNLPAGSLVLVPTYHCPTMVAPAIALGLDCAFYPLGSDGLPELSAIPYALASKAKVMLVAHLFGVGQSLASIRTWCNEHDILLIEDCAHTLFGSAGDRPVGAWGDYAVASLSKFLPVPEGGLLASNSRSLPELALNPPGIGAQLKGAFDVLQHATEHGRMLGFGSAIRAVRALRPKSLDSAEPHDPTRPGTPDYLEACDLVRRNQAPLLLTRLLSRLPLESVVSRRRANFLKYLASFGDLDGAHPLVTDLPDDCVPYVFPLWINDADRIYHALRDAGAPVFKWDDLWPGTPSLENDYGSQWSQHVVQFLCHQSLGDDDIDWVCQQFIHQFNR